MPQSSTSSDELSSRHLPDVSDSSFSFQIPGEIRDNLLIDDDLDFFKGTDVSIAPLASPLTTEPLFTVITPKSEKLSSSEVGSKLDSFPTLSYDHAEDHDTNPKHKKANPRKGSKFTTNVSVFSKPKAKAITTPSDMLPSSQGSPAVRLDNLRVELNMFSDKLFVGHSPNANRQDMPTEVRIRPKGIFRKSLEKKEVHHPISPRNNQKVIEGGISKTRCATTKLSSITSYAPGRVIALPNQNRALSDAQQINGDSADSSVSSAAAAGVAGRLMYSQKLINSFSPLNSDRSLELLESNNACQTFTSQDQQGGAVVDLDAHRPLTLSQLSPQKATPPRDPTPTTRDNVPMSPLRLPTKRSTSVASGVLQKRKRSKTDTTSADVLVPKSTAMPKTRLPATKKYPKVPKPISSNNSSSGMTRFNKSLRRTKVNGLIVKRPPVFKPEVPRLDAGDNNRNKDMGIATSASSCSTDATSASTSRLKNSNEEGAEPVNSLALNNKGKSIASSSHSSSRAAYQAPQTATIPVPFNFQTDKRSLGAHNDAKSANDDSKSRVQKRSAIPDYKAMHAAQEAELALLKENIQPVVPLPIHWETDYRLKERQKFDEKMREKEREQERLMSLRRKEREEQEEREVRELRKKAVPKAHEVPEWYKEAPKKKKDNAIVGTIDG